jgi:putative glutamine amidotransferase
VALSEGGLLRRLAGTGTIAVNSLHGQGVDRLAPGLTIEAVAPDGLIEAYRGDSAGFLLAVQWHPEWQFRANAVSVEIFRAFGDAARAWRRRKATGLAA